jgi:hypothetical protein
MWRRLYAAIGAWSSAERRAHLPQRRCGARSVRIMGWPVLLGGKAGRRCSARRRDHRYEAEVEGPQRLNCRVPRGRRFFRRPALLAAISRHTRRSATCRRQPGRNSAKVCRSSMPIFWETHMRPRLTVVFAAALAASTGACAGTPSATTPDRSPSAPLSAQQTTTRRYARASTPSPWQRRTRMTRQ